MTITPSKFTHINESFTCARCGKTVPPASSSCRNHCPFCLTSLHVDQNPGDRSANCGGLMRVIDYEINSKKGVILVFKCETCGEIKRNKANLKDRQQPDLWDTILVTKSK
jgi:formylmethanofuran dehydrogenase subunit E